MRVGRWLGDIGRLRLRLVCRRLRVRSMRRCGFVPVVVRVWLRMISVLCGVRVLMQV